MSLVICKCILKKLSQDLNVHEVISFVFISTVDDPFSPASSGDAAV